MQGSALERFTLLAIIDSLRFSVICDGMWALLVVFHKLDKIGNTGISEFTT